MVDGAVRVKGRIQAPEEGIEEMDGEKFESVRHREGPAILLLNRSQMEKISGPGSY